MPLMDGPGIVPQAGPADYQMEERTEHRADARTPARIIIKTRPLNEQGVFDPRRLAVRYEIADQPAVHYPAPPPTEENPDPQPVEVPGHTLASSIRKLGLLAEIRDTPSPAWDEATQAEFIAAKAEVEQHLGRSISGLTEQQMGELVLGILVPAGLVKVSTGVEG